MTNKNGEDHINTDDRARELGVALRRVRRRRGQSQEQVALNAGISTHTYGCLERGKSPSGGSANPTFGTLIRVFEALGIDPPSLGN
ncbi:helix-turn-helix transcriptional regulator [Microbacterium sp. SSW1-59]|uniref:helix-turn-helix domain-containing protein n=1 Tax=Microbacterium xanthum TaxID=3079794 RepID=UPI002AD2450F|nr:helix-turn-helix transcriptional regulator [Microbacterium sp. SSW1-59]MDZ8202728.1 helix-turn-helix transcriptional regulator [Microbacterium sp. SSW1-59]